MPQPMPPPPPPKQGMSMFTLILVLALITVGIAWYKGWFTVENNPETGKKQVVLHGDKFKADKEAAVKTIGAGYTAIKDKITGKETAKATAKPEEKDAIDKEIAELKKKLAVAEEAKKKAEAATDESGLKGLDDSVKKLLEGK